MQFLRRIGRFLVLFWRLLKTMFQILYGAFRVSKLPHPIVSIFGGARFKQSSEYAKKAHELGKKLTEHKVSVLTGGGPGIMEAISCGGRSSSKGRGQVMGIGITSLGEERNPCLDDYFELDYFFARKWLLMQYSSAFIIFPGGFGTLDELVEALTLIQTKHLDRVPIVLVGTEYWKDFVDWIHDELIVHGVITKEHLNLFKLTDDLDEALCWVVGFCPIK